MENIAFVGTPFTLQTISTTLVQELALQKIVFFTPVGHGVFHCFASRTSSGSSLWLRLRSPLFLLLGGDEAVYTDPLHEFLFNSGSANLEGSDWLELHMSPYPLKSL